MAMPGTELLLIATGFAVVAGTAAALLLGWRDWLALKHAELARPVSGASGETRVELAELRARVRKLEAIASCVDL